MKLVYVAGPITAYNSKGAWDCWASENFVRTAEAASLKLILAGVATHCPHTQGRYWNGIDGATTETWMYADFEVIRRCDAILVMPGWKKSKGTLEEIDLAKRLRKSIFFSVEDCIEWAFG